MKDQIPGIMMQVDAISPEVERAQRMAELEQIARYRTGKLKQYQEWSDPVKRAARQAKAAAELEQSRAIYAKQLAEAEKLPDMPLRTFAERITIVPVIKAPLPKLPWYKKLFTWLKR